MKVRFTDKRGMALLELLVAMGILALVLAGLYGVLQSQQRTYSVQEDLFLTQQDLRLALDQLIRDIRMAGFGVPRDLPIVAQVQNGTATDPAAPDTLVLNRSPGPWTTPSSTVITGGNWIQVENTQGFAPGQTLDILRLSDYGLEGTYQILSVDAPGSRLALDATPSTLDGILLVRRYETVTYQVVPDPATGSGRLIRTDWVGSQVLAQGIQDFQVRYRLADGTWSDAPTDLGAIRQLQVTLVGETRREVSQQAGVARTRVLQTVVSLRNLYGRSG